MAAATLLSIGGSVGFDVADRFVLRRPEIAMSGCARVDEGLTVAAYEHGLYLRFINFQGRMLDAVTLIYFRACYILYPQPVLVGDPSVVANFPDQVLAGNFEPTDQWLLQHGIHSVLTYHYDRHHFLTHVRHVPAPPPATR